MKRTNATGDYLPMGQLSIEELKDLVRTSSAKRENAIHLIGHKSQIADEAANALLDLLYGNFGKSLDKQVCNALSNLLPYVTAKTRKAIQDCLLNKAQNSQSRRVAVAAAKGLAASQHIGVVCAGVNAMRKIFKLPQISTKGI